MSQPQITFGHSRGPGFLTGVFSLLIGTLIMAITFGFVQVDPSKIQVPRLVLAVFGLTFCVAGVWSIIQRAISDRGQDTASVRWMSFSFALLILLADIGDLPVDRLWVRSSSFRAESLEHLASGHQARE